MYNVDMPHRLPLPPATLAMSALNASAPSLFLPNDTISTIFDQLMVEEWPVRPNFEGYYKSCAPATCTYTVYRRADLLFIIATLVSLFGGLVVTFRLLVPIAARLVYWTMNKWRGRHINPTDRRPDPPAGNCPLSQ
jgi:hypothetical protein